MNYDKEGLAQLPAICIVHDCRMSARLMLPQSGSSSGRGDQLRPEWRSLPSSLRLAMDVQAVPQRNKGLAAEIPGCGKNGWGNTRHIITHVSRAFQASSCCLNHHRGNQPGGHHIPNTPGASPQNRVARTVGICEGRTQLIRTHPHTSPHLTSGAASLS